jgi:flagellar hook-length control protein FliK
VQPVTPDKVSQPQTGSVSAPGTAVKSPLQAEVQPEPQPVPVMTESEDFDPVEFRLAMKPSRYGTVNPYQQSATPPPPAAASTSSGASSAQADASAVIKGAMQQSAANATQGPAFASVFSTDASALGFLNVANDFDLMPGSPALSSTPIQSGGLTNPVLQNVSAAQSHPATQAVAALIVKNAQNNTGPQTLAIQLDPPELGRLQLKMKYEKGEPLKVHVVLEKADTLAMFQRDAHALENALNQAGLKTDGSSLSFNLAQDNSAFQQTLSDQGHSGQHRNDGWTADGSADVIETKMSVFTDPDTGLTHYNLLV